MNFKNFEGTPDELIKNTEAIYTFLNIFNERQRTNIASMCMMLNVRDRVNLADMQKAKEKAFREIENCCRGLENGLKSSYNTCMKS